MRRVTNEEIVFYNHVADRINCLLGGRECPLNQSSLAERIGWNRASLCNFVNRIDKSIAAHFIPRIARALNVSVEHLMRGDSAGAVERHIWDPRSDDTEIVLEKLRDFRRRKARCLCLTGILPTATLLNHGMVANFVDSMVNGASPAAAERWHEMIEALRQSMKVEGAQDIDYIIPLRDLLRLPTREPPYQGFTDDEVVHLLDNLKKEWVRQRDLRIIAADDELLTPDVKLELASNISLMVVGCETQVRCRKDLRIDWDDDPNGVRLSRECLINLKRSAGFGVRERPSAQQVERLIDKLLLAIGPNRNRELRNNRQTYPLAVAGLLTA